MGFEPMIEVLQTSALPLGYVAEPPRFYPKRGRLSKSRYFRRRTHPSQGFPGQESRSALLD